MRILLSIFALLLSVTIASPNSYCCFSNRASAPTPPAADAYIMGGSTDSGGTTVGVDCTASSPCGTYNKALSMRAANLVAYPDFRILLITNGAIPIPVTSTAVYNSTHTPPPGHMTHISTWPSTTVVTPGINTAGTWTGPTTLPAPNTSGVQACVSTALQSLAPLTEANAAYYPGVMWINVAGTMTRIGEPIRPLIGSAPDVIPGTPGTAVGSITQPGPTANFTSGSANIVISDLSKIGIVGDPIAFNTAVAPFNARPFLYYIKSKAAATGSGNITVGTFSGAAATPTATLSGNVVADALHPNNSSQWTSSASGINQFPVNAGYNTALNQTDAKLWMPSTAGSGGGLFPIAAATSSQVTLAAHAFWNNAVYAGQRIRRWNIFEDLGTNSAVGEMYTNRTTGTIYLVPPAGVTCASLNVAWTAILPGPMDTIFKVSSALADGSASNVPVGNLEIDGVSFRYANTCALSGRYCISGNSGGFIGGGDSFSFSSLDYALTFIGASNIVMNGSDVSHVGGSGIWKATGTNNFKFLNSSIVDAGGHGFTSGMGLPTQDSYHFSSDTGSVLGTATMGPSTPSWNTGGGAVLPDLTGASDCCMTMVNSTIAQVGLVADIGACYSAILWQNEKFYNNHFIDCPNGTIQETSAASQPSSNYAFGQSSYGIAQSYGFEFGNNLMEYAGYEIPLAGPSARVPGAYGGDFGLFYIQGAQDGLGDGSHPLAPVYGNVGHDVTAGCYSTTSPSGTVRARMIDGILDYHDGNSTNGVDEENNLFYNSTTVNGVAPCGNRLTQHTGNMRSFYINNSWVGNFPNTYAINTDYNPRQDVVPQLAPFRSTSFALNAIVFNNQNEYKVTTAGTTGASASTEPTCSSGACLTDGSVVWTWQQGVAAPFYEVERSNITAWSGGNGVGGPNNIPYFDTYSQYVNIDTSTYFQAAQTMTNWRVGAVTFAQWQALGEDVHATNIGAPASNPNFVDMSGASGAAGFKFAGSGSCPDGTSSPVCALGFTPPNWTLVGVVPGIYIASGSSFPPGSDANPCTRALPCASYAHGLSVMQGGSLKVMYVEPGTIAPGAAVHLTSADNGETVMGDPTNPAYNSAVLDATGLEEGVWLEGANNVQIGPRLAVLNANYIGVCIHGGQPVGDPTPHINCQNTTTGPALYNTVTGIEAGNFTVPDRTDGQVYFNTGGVMAEGLITGTHILNNYFHDTLAMGMRIGAEKGAGSTDDISHARISGNVILKSASILGDMAPIYLQDLVHTSTDLLISHNFAREYQGGAGGALTVCIYGDAATSQLTITGNICGPPGTTAGSANSAMLENLCGQNNVISGNIFDLGTLPTTFTQLYSTCGAPAVPSASTGNVLSSNIFLMNYAGPLTANDASVSGLTYINGAALPAYPSFSANVYWNYGGGATNWSGNRYGDTGSPQHFDPMISGTTYTIDARSAVFSTAINFPPIAGIWGPPGFTIPASATAVPSTVGTPPAYVSPTYSCNYLLGATCGNETVSRSTTAGNATDLIATDPAGTTVHTYANNVVRVSTGKGLLIEEGRTNTLFNSSAPATQTTASQATGTHCLWVNGAGSALASGVTAVISGAAAATNGNPNCFSVTTAGTVLVTVTGALNSFQLEAGAHPTSYCQSTGAAACVRGSDNISFNSTGLIGATQGTTIGGFNVPYAPTAHTCILVGFSNAPSNCFTPMSAFDGSFPGSFSAVQQSNNVSGGALAISTGAPHRIAFSYDASGAWNISLDGVSPLNATGAHTWTVPTTMSMGVESGQLNGFVTDLALYPNTIQTPSNLMTYSVPGKAY